MYSIQFNIIDFAVLMHGKLSKIKIVTESKCLQFYVEERPEF